MEVLSVAEAREQFSDLMAQVAYSGQRVLVERRGKPMMAWISIDDLQRLETLERQDDSRKTLRIEALAQAAAARRRIRLERSGEWLPASADILDTLRNERVDELTGLR